MYSFSMFDTMLTIQIIWLHEQFSYHLKRPVPNLLWCNLYTWNCKIDEGIIKFTYVCIINMYKPLLRIICTMFIYYFTKMSSMMLMYGFIVWYILFSLFGTTIDILTRMTNSHKTKEARIEQNILFQLTKLKIT